MTRTFAGVLALTAVLGLAAGGGAAYLSTRNAATGAGPVALATNGGAPTSGLGGPSNGRAATPGVGQGLAGGANGQGFGGTNNSGTVEKVDGTTATVKTASGNSVEVQLAGATVQRQVKAAPGDLKVGDNVFGRGEPNPQGIVALTTLQIVPTLPGGRVGAAGPGPDQANRPAGGARQGADGAAGAGRQGAAGGPSGAAGGGPAGRGFVVGSIAKIDGKNLTVNPPNGSPVLAALADDAQIERVAPAQPSDLKAGQTVALQRPPGGSGAAVLTITSG